MCETATAAYDSSNDQSAWPIEDLTRHTTDGSVAGRLVETRPDLDRIVVEALNDPDTTISVDVSKCRINEALFKEDIGLVTLTSIETFVTDIFLHVYADEKSVATVYTHDAPLDEQRIVPRKSEDDPSYEIVKPDFQRAE